MRHIHVGGHPHHDHDVTWLDEYCARDAGPSGRESAALRILEVAHEIDRIAFVIGEHSAFAGALRAMAARLMVSDVAVPSDMAVITAWLCGLSESEDANDPTIVAIMAALVVAADLLRPFAAK